MKTIFASQYSRDISNQEYPIEIYCYGHFNVKFCEYYNEDCPKTCSFAKYQTISGKGEPDGGADFPIKPESKISESNSRSFSSPSGLFKNGLQRFLDKYKDYWNKK